MLVLRRAERGLRDADEQAHHGDTLVGADVEIRPIRRGIEEFEQADESRLAAMIADGEPGGCGEVENLVAHCA